MILNVSIGLFFMCFLKSKYDLKLVSVKKNSKLFYYK